MQRSTPWKLALTASSLAVAVGLTLGATLVTALGNYSNEDKNINKVPALTLTVTPTSISRVEVERGTASATLKLTTAFNEAATCTGSSSPAGWPTTPITTSGTWTVKPKVTTYYYVSCRTASGIAYGVRAVLTVTYVAGDANLDGLAKPDILDILAYNGLQQYNPPAAAHPADKNFICRRAADANGDGVVDLNDVIYLINFVFGGGLAPKPGGVALNC